MPGRPYKDVDANRESITGPNSELQRTVPNLPPPRNPEGMEVSDTKESPEKETEQVDRKYTDGNVSLYRALSRSALCSMYSLDAVDEKIEASDAKHSPEKEPVQADRKYENGDGSTDAMLCSAAGLQCAVPNLPPPLHHEGMEVSDTKESPEKEPDQEDRKYEDVDPHGESITGPSSGLQRAVPTLPPPRRHEGLEVSDTKESPEKEPEQEDRKYEDVDGGAHAMLGPELQRTVSTETSPPHLDMGDHVVVCAEYNETCHDTSYTQEDTDRDEEPEAPDNKAGGRKTKGGPVASADSQDDPDTSGIRYVDRDGISNQRQQPVDAGTDGSAPKTVDCNTPGLVMVSASNHGLINNAMYVPGPFRQDNSMGMWKKMKSGKVCWLVLGLGLLVIAAVSTAAILVPRLGYGGKVTYDSRKPDQMAIMANLNQSATPSWWTTVFKNNISASVYSTSPSSEPFRKTSNNVNTEALPTTTVTFLPTTARPCKRGWSECNNHCYKFFRNKVSWGTANEMCKELGANLASVTSAEENNFIARLVTNGG
ncbi:NCAN [Branchiostoma lanceolatum]|uniref:NCAN protein n=1 Tax=Branchiostoma lanceolatum TaxID=7740 RepID=A0A8J9YZI1_BRALA|nr:NCAN [Branchiostoma lanceolatum]